MEYLPGSGKARMALLAASRSHGDKPYIKYQGETWTFARFFAEADAVAQAQPGQIAPGTTAVTIEGTRHRSGVWNGQPVTSEHPVSFTVFVVCPPTYPTCHVLRLSQLDNPLR